MWHQVWIGRYIGDEPHSFQRTAAHTVGGTARADVPDEAHAYMVALSVGQLALVVFGHMLDAPLELKLPAQFEGKLTPIWAPSIEVVGWPPPEGIDYQGLYAVVHSFGEPIPAAAPEQGK